LNFDRYRLVFLRVRVSPRDVNVSRDQGNFGTSSNARV
jgi:hypothetical protein